MRLKKFLAVGLAVTMTMGSSVVAFADDTTITSPTDGSASGTGSVEAVVDKDIFKVVLPTISDTSLNFILDPQGVIAATSNAKYTGANFEAGKTLFFQQSTNDYKDTSAEFTITSKSAVDVDVTLSAKVTGNDSVKLSSDSNFAGDTDASMYLGVIVDTDEAVAITDDGATVTKKLENAVSEYEVKYSGGNYVFDLKDAPDESAFKTFKFKLTGASNANGDWTGLDAVAPKVELTWNVTKHVDQAAPSVAKTTYEMTAGTPVEMTVDFGKGDKAASAVAGVYWGSQNVLGSTVTYADGKLTLISTSVDYFIANPSADAKLVVTFNDTANTSVTITLNRPQQ